jgi:uncharacterized tellurite resistance protein B-like protein
MSFRRREWLLKVAMVELGLWVARGDGSVSRKEAGHLLQVLREWGTSDEELSHLKKVGEVRVACTEPPTESLRALPRLLTQEQGPVFLETLAEVVFKDQVRATGKVGRLLDIARALSVDPQQAVSLVNSVAERVGRLATPAGQDERTLLLSVPGNLNSALAELGIDRPDPNAARRAYRKLTLLYHPDRNPATTPIEKERLLRRLLRVRNAYQQVLDQCA